MWAVGKGDFELIETLLEFGAEPGIRSKRGETALDLATKRHAGAYGQRIKALLEKHHTSSSSPKRPRMDTL